MSLEIINVNEITKGDLYWEKISLEDKVFICEHYIKESHSKTKKERYKQIRAYILNLISQIDYRMIELGI